MIKFVVYVEEGLTQEVTGLNGVGCRMNMTGVMHDGKKCILKYSIVMCGWYA